MLLLTPTRPQGQSVQLGFKYVTHRPNQPRQARILATLKKHFSVDVPRSIISPTTSVVKADFKNLLRMSSLGFMADMARSKSIVDNFAAMFYPMLNRSSYLMEYGGVIPLEATLFGNRFLAKYTAARESVVVRNAKGIICINQPMHDRCVMLGANDILTLPNYPSRSFSASCNQLEWRTSQGIELDTRVALFVGNERLREIYGIDLLFQAWKRVCESSKNVLLVVICKMYPWLLGLAKSVGIDGKVLFVDFCDRTTLANWINASDVCIAPRTPSFPSAYYNDQDSTKISEYAAFSKRIVANNYLPSSQYHLVNADPESMAEGIMKGFEQNFSPAIPHHWEDLEVRLVKFVMDRLGD